MGLSAKGIVLFSEESVGDSKVDNRPQRPQVYTDGVLRFAFRAHVCFVLFKELRCKVVPCQIFGKGQKAVQCALITRGSGRSSAAS